MLIDNDVSYMPVDKEIEHIVNSLNLAIKKIGCKKLLLNNNNTLEDIAFLEIYTHNDNLINADLLYMNNYIDEIKSDNLSYIGNDTDILLDTFNNILNNNTIAIINTDTLFTEKSNSLKINYNIEVFKDYTTDYIQSIIKYYNITNIEINNSNKMSKTSQEILKDLLLYIDITEKYSKEALTIFREELPKHKINNATIYNSLTTNHIKSNI